MKTAKKIGMVSGGLLSAAQNAEASLARQEARNLESGIPDGHPLLEAADRQKALIGDLAGLPPGHPLLVAMQQARERYNQQQEQKTEEQGRTAEVRKANKIDADEARRKARILEDEQSERRVIAAKKVDSILDSTLGEVRKLYKTMAENEEILNIDPLSRAKVGKLKRLLFAAERGLSECRIAKARA
jgi:hypothetical protein